MEIITKKEDLKRHVTVSRNVTVKDMDGTEWTFEILPVSLFTWDETASWAKMLKDDADGFLSRVKEAVGAPSVEIIRNVLLKGVKSPKLTNDEKNTDDVPVNDLMRRDILVINLYGEIVNLSFEKILKAEVPHAKPTAGHKG